MISLKKRILWGEELNESLILYYNTNPESITTVEPRLTPPRYYGNVTLFWPKQNLSQSFSYLKNPFNTASPLIQSDFCGPLVTGLTYFHSICGFHFVTEYKFMIKLKLKVELLVS